MKFLRNRWGTAASSWEEGREENTGWVWRGTQRTGSFGVGDLRGSGVSSGSLKLNLITLSLSHVAESMLRRRKSGGKGEDPGKIRRRSNEAGSVETTSCVFYT